MWMSHTDVSFSVFGQIEFEICESSNTNLDVFSEKLVLKKKFIHLNKSWKKKGLRHSEMIGSKKKKKGLIAKRCQKMRQYDYNLWF